MKSFVLMPDYDDCKDEIYTYVFQEDTQLCQIHGSWSGSTGKCIQTVSLVDINGSYIWSTFYWGSAFSWIFSVPLEINAGSSFVMEISPNIKNCEFMICIGML